MPVLRGGSRIVLLVHKYAIKMPRIDSWRLFLYGLLANIHEKQWADGVAEYGELGTGGIADYVCPIAFYVPGGFLSVMPRCHQRTGLYEDFKASFARSDEDTVRILSNIVEDKDDSVGILNGKIVAVDYGS